MRVEYPYVTSLPACGDARRWPDVLYAADHLFLHAAVARALDVARIFDDDLRCVVITVWHNGDDTDEQVLCNILDAVVDEQDRRRQTPLRPRPPAHGGAVRYVDPSYPPPDWM